MDPSLENSEIFPDLHSTAVPLEPALAACGHFDYHVSVHPFDDVETYYVYPMSLKEPLATIEIPLLPGDARVLLDLQAVLDRCYDAGPYAREIDYSEAQIVPALKADQAAWVTEDPPEPARLNKPP